MSGRIPEQAAEFFGTTDLLPNTIYTYVFTRASVADLTAELNRAIILLREVGDIDQVEIAAPVPVRTVTRPGMGDTTITEVTQWQYAASIYILTLPED